MTPTTIKAEYLRALAAEKALSDRIAKLEGVEPPPVIVPPAYRPFPAPATSRTVTHSGGSLQSFVDGTPDGSIINVPNAVTGNVHLKGRHNLVFVGAQTTLKTSGSNAEASNFYLEDSTDIVIRGFALVGDNPGNFHPGQESQMGVASYGCQRVEVDRCAVLNVWGDGVYAAGGSAPGVNRGAGPLSDYVWTHDSSFAGIGRMGIAVVNGNHVRTERCTFANVGISILDIEVEVYRPDAGGSYVDLLDCTVDGYGLYPGYTPWLAEVNKSGIVTDVTIARNRITRGAPSSNPNRVAGGAGLVVRCYDTPRRQRIAIVGNVSTVSGSGMPLALSQIDGLIVTGNTQPLNGGPLANPADSTGVVMSGNVT